MTEGMTQSIQETLPAPNTDMTRFWSVPHLNNLECLSADFQIHHYAAHTHEAYAIGIVERGVEHFHCRGIKWEARPGQTVFVNPDDLHDGWPGESGYHYRMFYPSVDLMTRILSDMSDGQTATPLFHTPVINDPDITQSLRLAHRSFEQNPMRLAQDENFLSAFSLMLNRYGQGTIRKTGKEHRAVARVFDYMSSHFSDDLTLDRLAKLVDLSPHYLLRVFKRHKGFSPQICLISLRVNHARQLLKSPGLSLSDIALACGFYDQSHFTRSFKRIVGVTPGQYAKAWSPTTRF